MAKELEDLTLDEISLVDSPANPGARITLFKRDGAGRDVAAKCLAAVRKGDVSGLTRDDFWTAIESAAKAYSAQAAVTVEKATTEVLRTPAGAALYAGYCAAPHPEETPVAKAAARLSKRDEAWSAIEAAARERRKEAVAVGDAPLSEAAAISAVCRERPDLYSDYVAASGTDAA